ncbi:MAG: multiprotein bridging factor aMBF1 [Desulfurococcales archaeon]|nr:multiprotein bridging factor aMBF1 [Desulfurococcales archaeon]
MPALMQRRPVSYCESCGRPIHGKPFRAEVDGVEMELCLGCYTKMSSSGRAKPLRSQPRTAQSYKPRRRLPGIRGIEALEIVTDYAERIKRAREERGWPLSVLAEKLRISESLLRKIESGKYKPPIELARKMESLLRVKLVVPSEEPEEFEAEPPTDITLGDIVVIRREEE